MNLSDFAAAANTLPFELSTRRGRAARTTILVLLDDPLVRTGLVAALRENASFDVMASDFDVACSADARIDVIFADYTTATHLADPAVRAVSHPLAAARIVALTSRDHGHEIRRALEAGVLGYLLLGGPLDELAGAVAAATRGMHYLGRAVAERLADGLSHDTLTSREGEVLQLLVAGDSNKRIAGKLHIEVGTVKSHVSAILTKLDATSRTHAAGIAFRRGLVGAQPPAVST